MNRKDEYRFLFNKVIEYLQAQETPPALEIDESLKKRIRQDMQRKKKKRNLILLVKATAAAAVLCACFWIGANLYLKGPKPIDVLADVDFLQSDAFDNTNEVTLLIGNKEKYQVENDSRIAYKNDSIYMKQSQVPISYTSASGENSSKAELNQLFVPSGRRIQILLSDNSRIWVNSSSKLVYPATFDSDKREIYVEGEVYVDVTPDEKRPFIVKTSRFDVKVLGTSFNVCAYKEEETSSVVLVRGHVNVKDLNDKEQNLFPNELVAVGKSGLEEKRTVRAADYIAWIDNLLILKRESLFQVMLKLARYYRVKINISEEAGNLQLSGKLDLCTSVEDILSNISSSLPIVYNRENDVISVNLLK